VSRVLAIFIGVALGGLAGVVLAVSSLIEAGKVLGPGMAWFEPYFRLAGVALGGLILAAAFLVVGVGVGRWRRPIPTHRRRSEEVRW
jgi:hypothetical protein